MSLHNFEKHKINPVPLKTPNVPANVYGALVGVLNGPLSDADNNHIFIPVHVAAGNTAGVYKIAFNVESNAAPKAAQYYVLDEAIQDKDFPHEGFSTNAHLSYHELGLVQSEFKTIQNGLLRTVVHSSVQKAKLISAYGFTFQGGGLHDIHYNNGEKPSSGHANRPGKDGALALYFHDAAGRAIRRWIFIKFQTQTL
jgi:uncharacterized protein YukJ